MNATDFIQSLASFPTVKINIECHPLHWTPPEYVLQALMLCFQMQFYAMVPASIMIRLFEHIEKMLYIESQRSKKTVFNSNSSSFKSHHL
jgi:hypothetical protein